MADTAAQPAAGRFHNLTDRQLVEHLDMIQRANEGNKKLKAEIDAEIERRHGARLDGVRQAENKDFGTFSVDVMGGGTAKREIKKEVKYNSDGLLHVMAGMTWDQACALFKIDVSVPEKVYAGLAANPELKAKIDACRTVTPKPQAIKLTFADA